jgi:hypothetical protein
MDKRYRVVPPLEGVHSVSSFVDRIYTEIPAEKPDHPTCYEGEWVCSHAPCPVRMVRLRVKALYHQHLPLLRCPLCLRTLTFRQWLAIITLQEIPPEPPAKKARPSPSRKRSPRSRKTRPGTAAPSM